MGNTISGDTDVSTDVMTNVCPNVNHDVITAICPDVRTGVDIGVNTDSDIDGHADEHNHVAHHNVEQRVKRPVVDDATQEKINKLTRTVWFLEKNVEYYRNWLLEIEEKICDCCGDEINMPDETYACTECCKFICEDCVGERNEHTNCKRVLYYDELAKFHVENSDDEDDDDENTESEEDDEHINEEIEEEDEKKDAEKPYTDE